MNQFVSLAIALSVLLSTSLVAAKDKTTVVSVQVNPDFQILVDYSQPLPELTVITIQLEEVQAKYKSANGKICEKTITREKFYGRPVSPEIASEGAKALIYLQPLPDVDWIVVDRAKRRLIATVFLPEQKTIYYPFKVFREIDPEHVIYTMDTKMVVECDSAGKCQAKKVKSE